MGLDPDPGYIRVMAGLITFQPVTREGIRAVVAILSSSSSSIRWVGTGTAAPAVGHLLLKLLQEEKVHHKDIPMPRPSTHQGLSIRSIRNSSSR